MWELACRSGQKWGPLMPELNMEFNIGCLSPNGYGYVCIYIYTCMCSSCMCVNVFCVKTKQAFSRSSTAVGTTPRAHLTSTLKTTLHKARAFFKASHRNRGRASRVLPSSAFCRKRSAQGTSARKLSSRPPHSSWRNDAPVSWCASCRAPL